jgi:hypothetical protein
LVSDRIPHPPASRLPHYRASRDLASAHRDSAVAHRAPALINDSRMVRLLDSPRDRDVLAPVIKDRANAP